MVIANDTGKNHSSDWLHLHTSQQTCQYSINITLDKMFYYMQHSDGFYSGQLEGKFGLVPSNFVKEH